MSALTPHIRVLRVVGDEMRKEAERENAKAQEDLAAKDLKTAEAHAMLAAFLISGFKVMNAAADKLQSEIDALEAPLREPSTIVFDKRGQGGRRSQDQA